MTKKRLFRGIKRVTIFIMVIGLFIGVGKKIINSMKYPEFLSSTTAYHAVYGDDENRLKELDKMAQDMGYKDFNDYRVKTW